MKYKNNECQTTGTNHFVISSNSSKKSEDKRHNYIFLIRSGNAVTISFWQEDTFLVSFGSCSLGTADRPKSREKRKISNDTQIQAEKQRIRVNVVWEPLFQHYNGNVDHFFLSPFIYFSCIRSNWNYTPYVYYMTFMRLDQCRRWVYLKLLHKPSAYEKRVFFLCRLSSSWHRWFFSQYFYHSIHHFSVWYCFLCSCFIFVFTTYYAQL